MTPLLLALFLAASPQDALQEAAERYARGDAAGAAQAYQTAVDEGVDSADVWFNLGTSALKAKDVGRAVWALWEARIRAPWDEDVRFNLEMARKENQDTLVGLDDPFWLSLAHHVPRAALQWLALFAWLFLCSLFFAQGVLGPRPWVLRLTRASGVATVLIFLGTAAVELSAGAPVAVVQGREAVVRSTARVDGPEAFRVHAGLVVRPLGAPTAGIVRVRLGNGLEGYVEESAVRLVRGPR